MSYWDSLNASATPLTEETLRKAFDAAITTPYQPQRLIVSHATYLYLEAVDRYQRRWDQRAKRKLVSLKWRIYWAGPWGARRRRKREALWSAKYQHPGYKEDWE